MKKIKNYKRKFTYYPNGKKLIYFREDPNNKGRGSGHYYNRGKGQFSKYLGK